MFTVTDDSISEDSYIGDLSFYGKGLVYVLGVILFLELLRSQVDEVELLQLIPGIFFLIFFLSILFLFFFSEFLFQFPMEIDAERSYGAKNEMKLKLTLFIKQSFFLFSTVLGIVINTVVPLSLDSLIFSGEKTIENTWSLDEVLLLEILLLFLLLIISQVPLFFLYRFNSPPFSKVLSQFWKVLSFFMTILAGLLTPTLDGYTQLTFASFTFSFYLFILNSLQKREFVKLNIFTSFGT